MLDEYWEKLQAFVCLDVSFQVATIQKDHRFVAQDIVQNVTVHDSKKRIWNMLAIKYSS